MLIFRLLAVLATIMPFAAHADFRCQAPHAEYSALEEICPFSEGLAAIKIRGAWGYVDQQGRIVIPPTFDDTQGFSGGYAAVARDDKWGFIDHSGKLVVPLLYESVGDFQEGLAVVGTDGKVGYIDSQNRFVIAPRYAYAGSFIDGIAVVEPVFSQYALLDKRGEIVHRFPDDIKVDMWRRPGGRLVATRKFGPELRHLDGRQQVVPTAAGNYPIVADDVYFVSEYRDRQNLYGIMDQQGNWLVKPMFTQVESYHDGLAIAELGEKVGAVDKSGKFVIPAMHKVLRRTENGMYIGTTADEKSLTHLYDPHGKVLLTLTCADPTGINQGEWMVFAECGDSTWVIHKDGTPRVLPMKAPETKYHGSRLLLTARKDDGDGLDFFLLDSGKLLLSSQMPGIDVDYDNVSLLAAGQDAEHADPSLPIAILSKGHDRLAIVTPAGHLVSAPEWHSEASLLDYVYAQRDEMLEGPMVVRTERGWGAIDAAGRWVIQPDYDEISHFRDGLAFARKNRDRVVIDRQGREIPLPPGSHYRMRGPNVLTGYSDDRELLAYRLKNGVFEPISIENDVELGERFIEGLIPAQKSGRWGMLNLQFQWVLEPLSVHRPEPLRLGGKLLGWKVARSPENDSWSGPNYGLLDPQGRLSIPIRYRELAVEEELGLLRVNYADIYRGLLRPDGRVVVTPEYAEIDRLDQGWLVLRRHDQRGLMDAAGTWIVPPDNQYLESLDRGPYAHEKVREEERLVHPSGLISTRQHPADWPEETAESWWPKVVDEYGDNEHTVFYGFDWKARLRLPGAAKSGFSEGWTVLQRHNSQRGRWLANTDGRQVGPLPYEDIGPFKEGLARVVTQVANKRPQNRNEPPSRPLHGFIDTQGRAVIPPRFEAADNFANRRAIVVLKGNLGIIDDQGKMVLHSAWRCGQNPVLLDGKGTVVWPTGKSGC